MWVTITSACTAVGVVSSSDPLTKLNDAEVLFLRKNRPVPAERLIQEALAIYQRDGDEHGLGIAYREYGDLLESAAVEEWKPMYERGGGFLDKSITFDNRLSKAREFYRMALEHLEQAVPQSECKHSGIPVVPSRAVSNLLGPQPDRGFAGAEATSEVSKGTTITSIAFAFLFFRMDNSSHVVLLPYACHHAGPPHVRRRTNREYYTCCRSPRRQSNTSYMRCPL